MNDEQLPTGPDADAITRRILDTWPETVTATIEGAAFFSLDESNWPNYATIVWADDFDEGQPSILSRPGVFRVNVGVSKETYQRLVGAMTGPDYAAFDRVLPHPVYARQHWVSILNPTDASMRDLVMPLLTEAHDRLAAQRERQRPRTGSA